MRIRFNPLGLGARPRVRKARATRQNALPSLLQSKGPFRASRRLKLEPAKTHHRFDQHTSREPFPGQDHPIHYGTLRPELGQHMYSTGVFDSGLGRMGCAYATLKLYSHGPIGESNYTPSHNQEFRRLFHADTQLLSGSVWSACYYLYLVALRGLRSQEHSRDAHSQIYSSFNLPPIELFPRRHLGGSARRWNLYCRLGKSSDGRNVLSRPYLALQVSPGRIDNFFRIRTEGQSHSDTFLFLVLSGNLKTNSHQAEGSDHPPGHAHGSALQSLVDDIAKQSACAVSEISPLASNEAVLSAIRQRLLSYLPSSPLTSALDLFHLGITLQSGATRRRLVQNVLLNNDGSLKTATEMPLSLPTREFNSAIVMPSESSGLGVTLPTRESNSTIAKPSKSSDLDVPVKGNAESHETPEGHTQNGGTIEATKSVASWSFSETTHKKLDPDLSWRILNQTGKHPFEQQILTLQELDRHCQALDTKGFAVLADAIIRMYQATPPSSGFYLQGSIKHLPSSAAAKTDISPTDLDDIQRRESVRSWDADVNALGVLCNRTLHSSKIHLLLPGILAARIKLRNVGQYFNIFIALDARMSNDRGVSSGSNSSASISDEINYLRQAADVIIGRVCQAAQYEEAQSFVKTIAEAVLRFIRFRSANLRVDAVQIRAINSNAADEKSALKMSAFFDTEPHSFPLGDGARRKVKVLMGRQTLIAANSKIERTKSPVPHDLEFSVHNLEDGSVAPQTESSVISSAKSGGAANDGMEPGMDDADEEIDHLRVVNEVPSDVACEDTPFSANSGDAPREVIEEPKSAAKAEPQSKASFGTRVVAGIPCPTFHGHLVWPTSVLRQASLYDYRCKAQWTPRHAAALAETSPVAIERSITTSILQSDPSSLQDLLSTAERVMAAIPFNPCTMRFAFRLKRKIGNPIFEVAVLEKHERSIQSIRTRRQNKPRTLQIVLRDLIFDLPNTESPPQSLDDNGLRVTVMLRAHQADQTDTGLLAQVEHLCEAIRGIIRPVLIGSASSPIHDFAERCAHAILRHGETLAELRSITTVDVKASRRHNDRNKPIEAGQATAAVPRTFLPCPARKYIAIGSNVGDRIGALESACQILEKDANIHIAETSPLYETEPMYVENQDRFLNGVCEIVTDLAPIELLNRLQAIENDLGRHKTIDKGPRNIDLDILTYGQTVVSTDRLTVPHPLMQEREFVLRPLCDTYGYRWPHPRTGHTAESYRQQLPASTTPMYPLTPLGSGLEPLRSLDPKRTTRVMSILNVTPDSFSDGGVNQPTDLNTLKSTILAHIAAGATVIDIGGQSSRPNAEDVSAEEEISRILPAIELIKSLPEAQGIAISIDTYRAKVAEAAINAGAHIINDISAGLLDPDMLTTIARLGCTYVMMHMRGTPATMQNEENTSYPDGLLHTVAYELFNRLDAAREAGIRRWRIILDPGIGFAKTMEQNVELLQKFGELRNWPELHTFPWLVGTSRKGFIGKITGVTDAKHRVSGTAATVTAAVQGGAEIVRVHDVKEMVEVVKMADAMYRS